MVRLCWRVDFLGAVSFTVYMGVLAVGGVEMYIRFGAVHGGPPFGRKKIRSQIKNHSQSSTFF